MEILTLGNDLLRQKSSSVINIKSERKSLSQTIQKMLDIVTLGKGIGLACPQIGIMRRIFVVNIGKDFPSVFINPAIIETSQETAKYEEGCLSVPGFWADVIRPKCVKVQAWNEKGQPFTVEADGLFARVILHEYDHLEGILFIDHLSEVKRNKILNKIAKRTKK